MTDRARSVESNTKFDDIMTKYERAGVEPLENWDSQDLGELETLINAELQERSRDATAQDHFAQKRFFYPSCTCDTCRLLRGTPNAL